MYGPDLNSDEHCEHCEDAGNVIHRGRLMDDVMLVYFVVFVVR